MVGSTDSSKKSRPILMFKVLAGLNESVTSLKRRRFSFFFVNPHQSEIEQRRKESGQTDDLSSSTSID